MPCHYCGRELGFRSLVDRDFCSASHRRKYHEQIRRNLVEPPSGPPAGIAAFHFGLPASNREAAPAMVSAEKVLRRDTPGGPWAAMLAIEAPLGAAFRAGVVAIRPRQTQPAGVVCRGPVAFGAGAENGALAARLESGRPALWRNLSAGPALHVPERAPAGRNAAEPEARFLPYTFPHPVGVLPLEKPRPNWGLRSLSPNLRAAAGAPELRAISTPAAARARRPRVPALHQTFAAAWDASGEHLEVTAKARPARPRRLLHNAAAMAAPRPAAPAALPPLRADMDAPRENSMPPAAPDPCRPAMAPLTISIRPVEPAAKAAARRTRATAPGMPLVAAGFRHAGARSCAPRCSHPARAAVIAPGARPALRRRAAWPGLTISVSQVGGPSSPALAAAPRAEAGRREAASLTFGCRTTATEARCVPVLFSPAPERFALAPSSRYYECKPEASMWKPEPAPKNGVPSVPSPRKIAATLRVAPRKAGPVRDGARAQQLPAEPFTFPCMSPAPVEAAIEGFELAAALKPFEKEYKAWAARRQRFPLHSVWRYAKPAVAAALVLAAMGLGILAVAQRTPAAIERRAMVEWNESFRSGLNLWRGGSSWTVDSAGYARPTQLAVFVPSRELSNYRLHFLAQIEAKGVGWAFRVRDARNYYGAELRVSKPGPRPLLDLVRYTVVAGRRQDEVRLPLNVMAHNGLPFQVTLDAHGDSFRVEIEGETVDEWTDGRWPTGGIGFFSDSGSRARIYWVQLASHPDWLGRLCAIFATHNRPVTAQIQPVEADDDGNDGEYRIRRVGTGRSRVHLQR